MKYCGRFLLFLLAAAYFTTDAEAQFYNTDVLFYIDVESSTSNPQTFVYVFQFRNGDNYTVSGCSTDLRIVSNNLKNDDNYYEKQSWSNANEKGRMYNADMSNTKWVVYSASYDALPSFTGLFGETQEGWPAHTSYYAFKKDLSEYMQWTEPDYKGYGRSVYRRLSKSELKNLKFTGARDFLQ